MSNVILKREYENKRIGSYDVATEDNANVLIIRILFLIINYLGCELWVHNPYSDGQDMYYLKKKG